MPTVDIASPINWSCSLNRGLLGRWLSLPGLTGGPLFRDLRKQNDGTLTGMAATPTSTSGWNGSIGRRGGFGTLAFDASNDTIDVGTSLGNFDNTDKFSVSVWIYPVTLSSANRGVVCRDDVTTFKGWRIRINTSNAARFILSSDGSNFRGADSSALSTKTWYHLVGTWDGTTALMYVNGVLNSSNVTGGTLASITGARTLWFGKEISTASFFPGNMDDVRIWNRTLSAPEIQEIYRDSCAGNPVTLNWILQVSTHYSVPGHPARRRFGGVQYASRVLGTDAVRVW